MNINNKMEVNPTFHLRGVDYHNILRFFMGRSTPLDPVIKLVPQNSTSAATVNGKIDTMLYNDFNKIPTGSMIIAPVGRNAVVSHIICPPNIPDVAVCYHCRRKRKIISGIPVSSSVMPHDKAMKFNVVPPWICSFPCMLAAARSLSSRSEFKRSETLTMSLFTLYNPNQLLCEAPDPLLLIENGGNLSDEEYDKCDKIFHTTGIAGSINIVPKTILATQVQ